MKKQKIVILNKVFQFFILGIFLVSGFIFLPFSPAAKAAGCTWSINNYWVQPTAALRTDTVTFTVDLTRTGSPTDCVNQTGFVVSFYYKYPSFVCAGTTGIYARPGGCANGAASGLLNSSRLLSLPITASSKTFSDVSLDLSSFTDWSKLADISKIPFYVSIGVQNGQTYAKDTGATLNVSGESSYAPNGSFASVVVSFDQASVKSDPETEMPLKVYIKVLPSEQPKLVASDIKILTYINDKWNGLQQVRNKADCGGTYCLSDGQSTFQDIQDVSSEAGFKNGENTVTVKIFPVNSSQQAGIGSGKISISGIVTAPIPATTTKKYGCLSDDDNKYYCSPAANDTTCANPEVSFCQDYCAEVDPRFCGKTKAEADQLAKTPVTTTINTPPGDKIYNPLPEEELIHVFLFLAKAFLGGVAIWAVIFIIIGGFRMVVSAGNEEALTQAKKTVTWAIIGVIVASLSFSIIAIVQNLLNANVK